LFHHPSHGNNFYNVFYDQSLFHSYLHQCFPPQFQNHSPQIQYFSLIPEYYLQHLHLSHIIFLCHYCPLEGIHKSFCHDVNHEVFLLREDKNTVKTLHWATKTISAAYVNASKRFERRTYHDWI
jgi:hypothetical protein